MQILLIDAKQADDFLKKKKSESDQQCARIKADMGKLQSELNAKQSEYEQRANAASQSYTNDPRYIAVINESSNAIKTSQTIANAITSLRSKYGEPPDFFTRRNTKEQRDAWATEKAGMQRLESIRRDAYRIDREIDSFPATFKNEMDQRRQTAMAAVEAAREKLDKANQALESFQTPYFYLADFSPAALEMSLTDEKGHFVVNNLKEGTKVFAKVKSEETSEAFFWLVDLPQRGKKLLLSDTNLFTIPTNLP